ncbi:hypothetical protein EVAR_80233_1 [Eumeta japonica]|uniref:Uncharacterized protein n=1 Tax=Eumeta variegata TaxID=151549 RepID=A0A4C1UCE8_EUMVA|nr:hypothetical protein EVAR_80233_1 [Eumeta japonica]
MLEQRYPCRTWTLTPLLRPALTTFSGLPESRAELHRRGPITLEVSCRKIRDQRPAIGNNRLYPKMMFFQKVLSFEDLVATWLLVFPKFFRNGHGKIREIRTVVPPAGARRTHQQKLGVANLPREADPQNPTQQSLRPHGAQILRLSRIFCDLGNWDLVATWFGYFSRFLRNGPREKSQSRQEGLVVPHPLAHSPLQSNTYGNFSDFNCAERAFFVRFERRLACNSSLMGGL